jgi:hypothetical protein
MYLLDLKQEIQVQVRHQPDNDMSAAVERVRNHVDSNKLQFALEAHTPPTSPVSTTNISTSTLKSKMGNALRKTKYFFVGLM